MRYPIRVWHALRVVVINLRFLGLKSYNTLDIKGYSALPNKGMVCIAGCCYKFAVFRVKEL